MSKIINNEKDKVNKEYSEGGFNKMKTSNFINTDFLGKNTQSRTNNTNNNNNNNNNKIGFDQDKAISNQTVNQTEKKIEEYMGIIEMIESQVNFNEGYGANVLNTNVYKDSSENSTITVDRTSRFQRGDKRQNTFKNNNAENKDSFFSFKRLLEFDKENQGDADTLLVLTDKPLNAEVDGNTRVEMLLEKMICDKSYINDKIFSNLIIDDFLAQIYINLSPDAYKIMTEENPDEDLVFYFHNLVGYKNPEEKLKFNDSKSNLNEDTVKLKSGSKANINDLLDNKNIKEKNNNLDFIDFDFLESNRENLDNVINNIIRLKKGEFKSSFDENQMKEGKLNDNIHTPSSPKNLNFLKGIPLDLERDADFSEDKLIFEDEFRDVLIQKNIKVMKPHQAELFTISGNKEIKETLIEMKEKQMIDELLSVVGLEEYDPEADDDQEELDAEANAEEKLRRNLILNSDINLKKNSNRNPKNIEQQPEFDSYLNNNSHYKNESLYQDHNITMILKMSHTDDEEEKEEAYGDNKNLKFKSKNNNLNLNAENDLFPNNSRPEETKNKLFKKNSSESNNEFNSNNMNLEIKNELNHRNNMNEKILFSNNIMENNLEEENYKSRLDSLHDISNINNMINTMNLNSNINNTSILNNNNNNNNNLNYNQNLISNNNFHDNNANVYVNNFKNANFSPIDDNGVNINFGNFSPVVNAQKKSNIKKINFAENIGDNKSPIKHPNFALEDNVFLYSLEKSALDTKKKNNNKSVNKTRLNTSTNSQAKNSAGNNAKKKGISIQDILEGNFNEDLINKKAQVRANSNNGSFEGSRNNAITPASNKPGSKSNLINLNEKNKDKNTENSFARVNSKGKINPAIQGRDIFKNETSKKGVVGNARIIPTGKNNKKLVDKKDNFFNDDW